MAPIIHSAKPVDLKDLPARLKSEEPIWVDIDSSDPEQKELLSKVFRFHPLAIEYVDDPETRVKIEEFGDYLFITTRTIRLDTTKIGKKVYNITMNKLHVFLGHNLVVTVHHGESEVINHVSQVFARTPELIDRGAAYIAHLVLDTSVDAYFPIMDEFDDFLESIEAIVFGKFRGSAIQEIFRVKRLILSLRRYLSPQREMYAVLTNRPLAVIPIEFQIYFRDIYDHVLHINDHLDAVRDALAGAMESYLTQISISLGRVTKGLSVIATLSIPFVVLSGMWGMNFQKVPFSDAEYGFWIMVAIQLLLGMGLLAILKSLKML